MTRFKYMPDGEGRGAGQQESKVAMIDTYVIHRQPRYTDVHGARIGQGPTGSQPAAFNFLTSAMRAGTAASQVATRP